jgi:hypothetical protein
MDIKSSLELKYIREDAIDVWRITIYPNTSKFRLNIRPRPMFTFGNYFGFHLFVEDGEINCVGVHACVFKLVTNIVNIWDKNCGVGKKERVVKLHHALFLILQPARSGLVYPLGGEA